MIFDNFIESILCSRNRIRFESYDDIMEAAYNDVRILEDAFVECYKENNNSKKYTIPKQILLKKIFEIRDKEYKIISDIQ